MSDRRKIVSRLAIDKANALHDKKMREWQRRMHAIVFSIVIAQSACSTPIREHTSLPLIVTSWQLVSIQDRQGTTRIEKPEQFSLQFEVSGRVVMRLDCNRGMGSYEMTVAADGTSGSLTFGPLASTRALCPSPQLDERVIRDLADVRAYRLNEGLLYLSTKADTAILIWQSAPNSRKTP